MQRDTLSLVRIQEIDMSLPRPAPGEVIPLHPPGHNLAESVSQALFKTEQLEAMRLILPRDKEIPEHAVDGDFTLQCLEGCVQLRLDDAARSLQAGDMVFVPAHARYAIRALDDSCLLMTLARGGHA
jgi:quercetin dioxygenase-like cupin family protein